MVGKIYSTVNCIAQYLFIHLCLYIMEQKLQTNINFFQIITGV